MALECSEQLERLLLLSRELTHLAKEASLTKISTARNLAARTEHILAYSQKADPNAEVPDNIRNLETQANHLQHTLNLAVDHAELLEASAKEIRERVLAALVAEGYIRG